MNLVASAQYVKPYHITELGCDGLSSEDIARSTGRKLKVINQMITRETFKKLCATNGYDWVTIVTAREKSAQQETKVHLLPTRAAKALIATGAWEQCFRYLNYLFDCEQFAEKEAPKMAAKIIEQQKEIEALQAKLKAKSSKPSKRGLIDIPLYESDLFGNPPPPVYIKVHKDSVPEVMQLQSAIRHTTHVIKGCVEKNEKRSKRVEEIICNVVSIVIRETDNARLPPAETSPKPHNVLVFPKTAFTRDDAEARRQDRTRN